MFHVHLSNRALKIPNRLMTPVEVKSRWPWLNVNDISLASYGQFRQYN